MRQSTVGPRGLRGRAASSVHAAAIFAVVSLAGLAAACAGSDSGDAQCLAAFRNAEPRALPPYEVSPLDDAIRACSDLPTWRRAWDAVPGAHLGHEDPLAYLAGRCQETELAATNLCRSLAEQALKRGSNVAAVPLAVSPGAPGCDPCVTVARRSAMPIARTPGA